MSAPWELLADALDDEREAEDGVLPASVNVYPLPTSEQISAPAVVIRPDDPWISLEGSTPFGAIAERYAAVVAVPGSGEADTRVQLRELVLGVVHVARRAGWRMETVSAPSLTTEQGPPYLVAAVVLVYTHRE